jgi:hypothetical protein
VKIIKKIWKVLNRILDWIVFLLSGKGVIADEGVDAGILDYSGQGKNEFGK